MPYLFSDILDDPLLYERQESFAGGMDAFNRETLLAENKCRLLQNVIIQENHSARTRMGASPIGAKVPTATALTYSPRGLFWYENGSTTRLLSVVNAVFCAWDGSNWADVSAPAGWTADETRKVNGVQAIDLLYLTDGANPWLTYNGTTLTALGTNVGTEGDAPVGATMAAFQSGRVFAAGQSANPDTLYASDLGEAGDGKWDHVNFSIRIGKGEGAPITAIAPMQQQWLAVFKANSIHLVDVDPTVATAALWTVNHVAHGIGCVGNRAWCQFQNDVFFMSQDGIRSLRRMEATGTEFEVVPPLSRPMQPYIDRINWQYASTIVATKYEEFIFFAVPLDDATTPNYVLAYNARLDAWMGIWIGWNPTCFCVSRFSETEELAFGDSSGYIHQWNYLGDENSEGTYVDGPASGTTVIETIIESKSWNFGEPISQKTGFHMETFVVNTLGEVEIQPYLDGATLEADTKAVEDVAPVLPLYLPFDLGTVKPQALRTPLLDRGQFYEITARVRKVSGRLEVKSISVSAFLDTLANE